MEYNRCPKCNNTGRVTEKDGSIHVCFDCLSKGKFDQQDNNISTSKPLLRKIKDQSTR